MASRMGSPETWAGLAKVVPEEGIDGLLECLRVAPARAKAARALFYAAKAPLAGGMGGELVESRGGVAVRPAVGDALLAWLLCGCRFVCFSQQYISSKGISFFVKHLFFCGVECPH